MPKAEGRADLFRGKEGAKCPIPERKFRAEVTTLVLWRGAVVDLVLEGTDQDPLQPLSIADGQMRVS